MNQQGFDNYLQSYGFGSGTYFDGPTTRSLYRSYEMGQTPAWSVVMSRRQQEQQQGGGMDMVSMGGIAKGFMGGGQEGGASKMGGGGGWGGVVGGALSGAAAGYANSQMDPNMSNKKDGFGTKYRDSRAEVGGAVLGGVMGYYGLGGLAGPAVTAAHPVMEPTTRWMINTGDKLGGAGGALMMDPIGTVASGKYDGKELALGALMGPAAKWFKII
jgi:hypothetical protein